MDLAGWLLFFAGLVLLLGGAEFLVRGAAGLAARIGVPPLVVGLTVVAFATSSPELAVSVQAALGGQGALAIGNVVGSNIFNVLLILGLAALVAPLVVARRLVIRDVPVMIGASILLLGLVLDGSLARLEAVLLLATGAAYAAWAFLGGRGGGPGWPEGTPPSPAGARIEAGERVDADEGAGRTGAEDAARRDAGEGEPGDEADGLPGGAAVEVVALLGGLALLVLGSRWLVNGAVELARTLGIDEVVIGLTLVSAGTSLPEVATSVVAAARGARDIAVGNAVGSNIFNILVVLGAAGLVAPAGLPASGEILAFDLPVMIAVAVACLPIFFTGHAIARWEGALFLAYYAVYVTYLILAALRHEAVEVLGRVMWTFVLPLTLVTLGILTYRAARQENHGSQGSPGRPP